MYRIIATFLALTLSLPVMADYNAGIAAYKKKDFLTALKEFKTAAKQGSVKAHFRAGQMYYRGEGSVQDYALALKHFEKAADGKLVDAQYMVAYMHEHKQGVRRSNPTMAFNLYKKAAASGHAKAEFRLATLYAEGVVVPENLQRAFQHYMNAAKRGNAKAQFEVARLYEVGLEQTVCNGVASIHKCRKGLGRNLDPDHSDAQVAAKWFRKSADQGYGPAQYRLGEMYDSGRGVEKSTDKATAWYKKAADQGVVEARYKLAGAQKAGTSAAKTDANSDLERLADIRRAREGDLEAQLRVAKMYDKGDGVKKDFVQAYAWYNVAAAAGSPVARASRDAIEAVLNSDQIAEGQRLARDISRRMVGN